MVVVGIVVGVVDPPQAAGHGATKQVPVAKTCGLEEHPASPACQQMGAIEAFTSRLKAAERSTAGVSVGLKPMSRHVVISNYIFVNSRYRGFEVAKACRRSRSI